MRKVNVLLFEDSDTAALIAGRTYVKKELKVTFTRTKTAAAAKSEIQSGNYDIGIFDLIPDPQGTEKVEDVFKIIRELTEEGHIIVVLSGMDEVDPTIRDKVIIELGADDYLNKVRAGESRSAYIERIVCAVRRRERDEAKTDRYGRKKR